MQTVVMNMIIALLYRQTTSEILRLECETYANFSIVRENQRLNNATVRAVFDTDSEACKQECASEKRCKSINFNDGEKICELNNKSGDDPRDMATIDKANGWTYHSPSYEEILVGVHCRSGNNCRQNQKCIDICDCPGYKCIDKYKVMTDGKLNWTLARAKCRELGADLVSIANADEDNALSFLLPEEAWFWMGYNDIENEGHFKWSDGMPATYSNWGTNEAYGTLKHTEDCAMLRRSYPWTWYDAPCSWEIDFVCKFY